MGNASIQSTSAPMTASSSEMITLCTTVKNKQPYKSTYLVETGIIPKSVARNWFPTFASASLWGNSGECCSGQLNIEGKFVDLGPKESRRICMQVNAPYSGIEDKCGTTDYWTGEGSYKSYFMVANHCNYREGKKVSGYELYDVQLNRIDIYG